MVTATATCATGTLVSGGGIVTNNWNQGRRFAALTSSYPTSATTWTVTATIIGGSFSQNGGPPSLDAFALCAD